jgi:predicted MPP superfamily phosphohydrolase
MRKPARRRTVVELVIVAILVAIAAWFIFVEPNMLRTTEVVVANGKWPADRRPLTIAALADLHVGSPHIDLEKLAEVVRLTNALKPDLILLLGDYVNMANRFGDFVPPDLIAERLAELSAPLGVYAVLGNQDWWHDGARIRKALEQTGISVLDNERASTGTEEGPIWIAGIADDSTRKPDVAGTLAGIPEPEPVIVIAHDPAIFSEVPKRPVITLAGHTHGGQVYLPFVGALLTPGLAPKRWAYGHVRERGRDLFTSGGIGTSIFPIRFNMRPEIVHLRLGR